jgi:hypothetical protein
MGVESNPPPGALPVEPVFREFYNTLGGQAVLGPAIAPATQQNGICQYTANALMCYNPNAADSERFSLQPVGLDMVEREQPTLLPDSNGRQVDGFLIFDEFASLYDRMKGARYVGRPLTSVRINYGQERVEQYFENVGFYRLLSEPRGKVHLIAYGAAACREACAYQPSAESGIIGGQAAVEQLFPQAILRMGGVRVFGQPLTKPFRNADGSLEQVYEKVVLYSPSDDPGSMHLRPVAIILGTAFSLPGPRINDTRMVFYPVQGDQGYNVPTIFDRFIARHGGTEISGRPISEVMQVKASNIYRQCFENYCLDFDPSAPEELQIQLAALGTAYISQQGVVAATITPFQFTPDTVILSVGEVQPQIRADAEQSIMMMVVQRKDQRPILNIEGELTVFLPDGSTYQGHFPPTDANGVSSAVVPAQPGLANGTLLPYQVCVTTGADAPVCVPESYLIWNNP